MYTAWSTPLADVHWLLHLAEPLGQEISTLLPLQAGKVLWQLVPVA